MFAVISDMTFARSMSVHWRIFVLCSKPTNAHQ